MDQEPQQQQQQPQFAREALLLQSVPMSILANSFNDRAAFEGMRQMDAINASSTIAFTVASYDRRPGPPDNNFGDILPPALNFGGNDAAGVGAPNHFFGGGGGDDDDDDFNRPWPIDPSITLDSVGGLQEHVDYLKLAFMLPIKNPYALASWGLKATKGVIFHGPPGTGKTLLAKALGADIGRITGKRVSFFYHKGTELQTKWMGESERKLRRLFDVAKRCAPAILFFDEMDGLLPNRDTAGEACQAYISIVSTFLGEMDAVKRGDVLVIGATNRLDAIDTAVRRPGRIDKQLFFALPNAEARLSILNIHTGGWPSHRPSEALLEILTTKTDGFSGADLAQLCERTKKLAIANRENENSPVQVTEGDWMTSFISMRPSATKVYGSTLHLPESLHSDVLPLFEGDVKTLGVAMKTLFQPDIIPLNADWEYTRALLVVEARNPPDPTHLEDKMHVALNSNETQSTKYILDINSIQQRVTSGRSVPAIVSSIVGQVANSTSSTPVLLYVPMLNNLYDTLILAGGPSYGASLINALKTIKGPGKGLVATWTGPLTKGPTNVLQALFQSNEAMILSAPNLKERAAFFKQLFVELKGDNAGNKNKKVLLDDVVNSTKGDTVEQLYVLYEALWNVKEELGEMKAQLKTYKQSKSG